MRDERSLRLVEILMEARGYVPQEFLCEKLGIKERTLRNLILDTREIIERETGSSIRLKNNQGYQIVVEDEERLNGYIRMVRQEMRERAYALPISQEDRVKYEIRRFLNARDGVREEVICEEIYISKSTIAQDLRLVRKKLAEYGLSLECRPGHGLEIAGAEENVRSCIHEYVFRDAYVQSDTFSRGVLGQFYSIYGKQISTIVQDVTQKHGFVINDVNFKSLIIHILIALYRIENGLYVRVEPEMQKQVGSLETQISEEIRVRVKEVTGIDMPEVESSYMAMHFMGIRKLSENDVNLIRPETMNLVRLVLTEVLNEYGLDLFCDVELFTMMCVHVQPMLERVALDNHMENPMLEQIKKEFAQAYDMAVFAGNVLSKRIGKSISEDELGYLALHFQLGMERRNKEKKFRILTVCASGVGTARFMEHKIRARLADAIGSVESMGLREVELADLSVFDLILTSVPLQVRTSVPVLQVNYLLDERDLSNIEVSLFNRDSDIQEIRGYFDESLFFDDLDLSSRADVIRFLVEKMGLHAEVPADFLDSVLERENLAGTNIGNGVAIPHPMQAMLKQTHVAVALLRKPLLWNGTSVSMVFLLGIRKEAGASYALFNQVLLSLIGSEDSLNRIQKERTLSSLLSEVEKRCRLQKSEKPESIFQ